MVSVMKVEKASLESYADIRGLDSHIQKIKEVVELPLTHPELYEDIGIKPPKGVILYGEPGTLVMTFFILHIKNSLKFFI
jgi:26S proteasome regulatory subunit T2